MNVKYYQRFTSGTETTNQPLIGLGLKQQNNMDPFSFLHLFDYVQIKCSHYIAMYYISFGWANINLTSVSMLWLDQTTRWTNHQSSGWFKALGSHMWLWGGVLPFALQPLGSVTDTLSHCPVVVTQTDDITLYLYVYALYRSTTMCNSVASVKSKPQR